MMESPKSPTTMDGIPARISKIRLKSHFIFKGQYSARKMPVASPTGTANMIESTIKDKVPATAGKRPSNTCFLSSIASNGGVSEKIRFILMDLYPLIMRNPITADTAPSRIMVQHHEKKIKILSDISECIFFLFQKNLPNHGRY